MRDMDPDYAENLRQLFEGDSDDDLSTQYDQAVEWRDWFTCDMINDECRRRGLVAKGELPPKPPPLGY